MFWVVRVFVFVAIVAATHFGAYKLGYSKGVDSVKIDTVYVTETVVVDTPKVALRYVKVPGRVVPVNVDSIWNAALAYWKEHYKGEQKPSDENGQFTAGTYTAQFDTSAENGDLKLSMSFNSPMPLHPESYFKVRYELKKQDVFLPPAAANDWRDRIRFSAGVGLGLTPAGVIPTIYIGYGYVFTFPNP